MERDDSEETTDIKCIQVNLIAYLIIGALSEHLHNCDS